MSLAKIEYDGLPGKAAVSLKPPTALKSPGDVYFGLIF
jgi:ABC-type transporter Mla subunit MlaD